MYSVIPIKWLEKEKMLVIGKRIGKFYGMLKKRNFNIVLVEKNKGIGDNTTKNIDKKVIYTGKEIKIKF